MKIAIVCFNLSWQSGGPRLIFSLAQSLKKFGHAVVIYAPEFSGEYFKELWTGLDIRVILPEKPLIWSGRPPGLLAKICQKLEQEKALLAAAKRIAAAMEADFDVVNVHDFAYPVGYFYKKFNPKAKVIWTENDPPFMYLPKKSFLFDLLSRAYNFWKDFSSRKYFRAIDRVSVLDSYNELWCRNRGLKPVIVRPGVDAENFYAPVKDFTSRARLGKVRLLGLGSLNEYRRYEDTLGALKYLRDWGYDASALIIANDMWDEKGYRNKILGIVKENSLENFVTFNFQGVSEKGLKDAYHESDLFVYAMYLPPPRNGFGFSIGVFEAMAAGLPVVLCRTTTSTEVLEDGKTALFVDPMSPEQIAEKVKFLIDNPKYYFEIASAGQKFVKENLTWENYVKGLFSLIS
jgi:glycosyltransferase involved in cell wall biosynthesis